MEKSHLISDIATEVELARYADVLVNCALGHGKGISPGDIVLVGYSQSGAVLVPYLQKSITTAGGHMLHEPVIIFPPKNDPNSILSEYGNEGQIAFFPLDHKKALYDLSDHKILLKTSEYSDTTELNNTANSHLRTITVNQNTVFESNYKNIFQSYTLAYVPTAELAAQSNTSIQTFWNQIVQACYLDQPDALNKCRETLIQTKKAEEALNALDIRKIHMKGSNCDLHISLTPEARFRSSAGGNMPSYECFVTPAASKTNGFIRFSYPLMYKGHTVKDVEVHFKDGEATSWTASEGVEVFTNMMKLPGMKRLGEFALTDKRLSRINTVLPSATLFLENIGGTAHVAFGSGYKKCFVDKTDTPDFNEASDHKDMVIDGDFTVTATTGKGEDVVIFKDGEFTF